MKKRSIKHNLTSMMNADAIIKNDEEDILIGKSAYIIM